MWIQELSKGMFTFAGSVSCTNVADSSKCCRHLVTFFEGWNPDPESSNGIFTSAKRGQL